MHLDELFWETWSKGPDPTPAQMRAVLEEVAAQPQWIIDGIHGGQPSVNARRTRLEAADTIIYLDLPPHLCVWRLIMRRLALLGRSGASLRPNERLTWAMIQAAWNFHSRKLKDEVMEYAESKDVIILASPHSVETFVAEVSSESGK